MNHCLSVAGVGFVLYGFAPEVAPNIFTGFVLLLSTILSRARKTVLCEMAETMRVHSQPGGA